MNLAFAKATKTAIPLHVLTKTQLEEWLLGLPAAHAEWAKVSGFKANAGQVVAIPDEKGRVALAAAGLGDTKDQRRSRWRGRQ